MPSLKTARVISFSPDGTRLAIGTRHGRVHLYRWNGQHAEWLGSHDPDPHVEVWRLHFSADGDTLWTLSDSDKLRIVRNQKVLPFSPLGDTPVEDIVASPTENAVFVRLRSDVVLRFDDQNDVPRWQLSDLNYPRDLSISHDGRFLAISIDWHQRLSVVETEHGLTRKRLMAIETDSAETFYSHAFGHHDNWIVSASDDRTVALWDIVQGRAITSYIVPERGGRPKITASRTQPLIAVAEHLKVAVYQITGGEALETICHRPDVIRDFACDSSGARLATVSTAVSHIDDQQYMDYAVVEVNRDLPTLHHRSFICTWPPAVSGARDAGFRTGRQLTVNGGCPQSPDHHSCRQRESHLAASVGDGLRHHLDSRVGHHDYQVALDPFE